MTIPTVIIYVNNNVNLCGCHIFVDCFLEIMLLSNLALMYQLFSLRASFPVSLKCSSDQQVPMVIIINTNAGFDMPYVI